MNVAGITGFIAKKEVKKFPILSLWMKNMTCLFLDRDDMRQGLKTILTAVDNVKAGYSVFIMPEGTRNHNEEMLPFKEGSFKVAEKSGCPIVPIAFSNTDALYELHKPWIKKAKVVVHFGAPIYLDNITREEKKALAGKVQGIIADMLAEDKKLIG
jgi:1-acyl-sn-glycerol-3-phosphate acyltransferase